MCNSCEEIVDELAPWDLQRQYRTEVSAGDHGSNHNIFHCLVRVAKVEGSEEKSDSADSLTRSNDRELSLSSWREVQEVIATHQGEVESRLTTIEVKIECLLKMFAGLEKPQ